MTDIRQLPSAEAGKALVSSPDAVLIDVRTDAEWAYVGVPAVPNLKRISWQVFPTGAVDPDFVSKVKAAGVAPSQPVYLICRSGARSQAAAQALAAAGYTDLTNISDGFEGGLDANKHRGGVNGWKQAGLPWVQS